MTSSFDPGVLLGASYRLSDGTRVRLRLVCASDRPRVRALLSARGVPDSDLATERLLRFDPRARAVVCATALIDGSETMAGVGAIDIGAVAEAPDLLVIDDHAPAGVADLLAGALLGRARALARRRVA
jgi:hypothetical protein